MPGHSRKLVVERARYACKLHCTRRSMKTSVAENSIHVFDVLDGGRNARTQSECEAPFSIEA